MRAIAVICLVCATAVLGGRESSAAEATVGWHVLTNGAPQPPPFVLTPASPTITNLISFVASTDGETYVNECFASVAAGAPAVTVDSSNQRISVTFSAPLTNTACPEFVRPVSGVDGGFGPLSAGTWAFTILQNSYTFNVAEAPLALSIQAFTNSTTFQLSWPVSGDTFALERSELVAPGSWQAVTNPPTTLGGQNAVQIKGDVGTQFFRLRGLHP